jgi:hypothetical protein
MTRLSFLPESNRIIDRENGGEWTLDPLDGSVYFRLAVTPECDHDIAAHGEDAEILWRHLLEDAGKPSPCKAQAHRKPGRYTADEIVAMPDVKPTADPADELAHAAGADTNFERWTMPESSQ